MPLLIRNIAFIVIGLYFFINGLASGNPVSILIGAGLAVIAIYVAFGGKVHKKFQRKATMDSKTTDDDEFAEFVGNLKNRVLGVKSCPEAGAERPLDETAAPEALPSDSSGETQN